MNHAACLPRICIVANIPGALMWMAHPPPFEIHWSKEEGCLSPFLFPFLPISHCPVKEELLIWLASSGIQIRLYLLMNMIIIFSKSSSCISYLLFCFLLLLWCDISEQSKDPFVPDYFILSLLVLHAFQNVVMKILVPCILQSSQKMIFFSWDGRAFVGNSTRLQVALNLPRVLLWIC